MADAPIRGICAPELKHFVGTPGDEFADRPDG
jgi:hypothetical protein